MKLFSYVVLRDYGFAPNPFYGVCTLATCKPGIRKTASVGDWVIGTGSKQNDRQGFLVYAMQVTETKTFNEYWKADRFRRKRPNLRGSVKQAFGDNIYFRSEADRWHQENSHHSYADGSPNQYNITRDTTADRVLLSTRYAYWGGSGPKISQRFRRYNGWDICASRGYKCNFPAGLPGDFAAWFYSLNENGYIGEPLDWAKTS